MMGSGPVERLRQLESIERDIATAIHSSGQALQELSKEKPSMKQVESHTTSFIKTLENVEIGLTKQINYLTQVSTGQPHEGSCYAAQKDLLMAMHRVEHVKSRLNELEKIHTEHLHGHLASAPLTPGPCFSNSRNIPESISAQMKKEKKPHI